MSLGNKVGNHMASGFPAASCNDNSNHSASLECVIVGETKVEDICDCVKAEALAAIAPWTYIYLARLDGAYEEIGEGNGSDSGGSIIYMCYPPVH